MHFRSLSTLVFSCAMAALAVYAGTDRVEIAPRPRPAERRQAAQLRVDTRVVLIPVTVTDLLGAPFAGLSKEAFRVFEDGVEQQVRYFSRDDAPLSLGVVFDASRSMEDRLDRCRAAVSRFFTGATQGDEFFLVEFSDAPRLLCDFTADPTRIERALVKIEPQNWTALLDAVYMAIDRMKHARNARKALLILSDGGDNNSRYTQSEMKSLVREADVSIYSISIGGGLLRRHVRLLRTLADETGGRVSEIDSLAELPEAVHQLNAAMRNRYVLGYSSNSPRRDGLYRKVQVRLNPQPDLPPLRTSWRMGYYPQLEP